MHWTKASKCPCLTSDSGQPNPVCTLCAGKGKFWSDEQTIRGVMTSFSEKAQYNQSGEIISGVSYFTTMPNYKLSIWDRLVHFHSQIRYSEVITHARHGAIDTLKFKPTKVLIARSVAQEYKPKVDFLSDFDTKAVNWLPQGSEPQVGETYTVEYLMHPSWIIIDPTNVIRDTYVKSKKPGVSYQPMPQRVLVRLEYFVPEVI